MYELLIRRFQRFVLFFCLDVDQRQQPGFHHENQVSNRIHRETNNFAHV
jgi:hypothetical protein